MKQRERPRVSVVLEGYNESRALGEGADTLRALAMQEVQLDQVEVVLVGSAEQVAKWTTVCEGLTPFGAVRTVATDQLHYLALKNMGAEVATGEVLAFTDSDVRPQPGWLSAILRGIEGGADVVAGISLFKDSRTWSSTCLLRTIASSITWGWVIGKSDGVELTKAVGFMDHNVAFRREAYRRCAYRTDLGRTCGAPLLYGALRNAGIGVDLQPEQRVVHYFSWWYWLSKLHFRYGYEVFLLRRLDRAYPNQWIARTSVFEPLVTMCWHVLLDLPRWLRFSKLLRMNGAKRLGAIPLVVALSFVARTCEMLGMYSTLLRPEAMRRWAESV